MKWMTSTRANARPNYLTRDLITILVLSAAALAVFLGAGWLADHAPAIIAGLVTVACIALIGVLVAAVVAGPKS
jgi:hypothetical protein